MSHYSGLKEPLTELEPVKKPLTEKLVEIEKQIEDISAVKNPLVKAKRAEVIVFKTVELMRGVIEKLEG